MGEKVAILGASDNQERYSFKAFQMLQEYGHEPFPVSPKLKELEWKKAFSSLQEIPEKIDTLTMYVGPKVSSGLEKEILSLNPKRVIFNPGSENPDLGEKLKNAGIEVEEACTLVLLRTNQF